jgi:putative MFS transporter
VALYAGWSSRRSVILFVAVIGLALGGVAVWNLWHASQALLLISLGTLVLALSAVNAMLLPYSAEIYPTALRATGSGFAAAMTKFGGVLGPSAMLLTLNFSSGLHTPALVLGAVSLAALTLVAALLMLRYGSEVRRILPFSRRNTDPLVSSINADDSKSGRANPVTDSVGADG